MSNQGRHKTTELAKLRTKCWFSSVMQALNSPNPSATASYLASYLVPEYEREYYTESALAAPEALKRTFRNWCNGKVDIPKKASTLDLVNFRYTLGQVSEAVATDLKNPQLKAELESTYQYGPDESYIFEAFSNISVTHFFPDAINGNTGATAFFHAIHLGLFVTDQTDPMDACRYVMQSDCDPLIKLASCISLISKDHINSEAPENYIFPLLAKAFEEAAQKGLGYNMKALDILICLFDDHDCDSRLIEMCVLDNYIQEDGFEGLKRYEPFTLTTTFDKGCSSTKITPQICSNFAPLSGAKTMRDAKVQSSTNRV